MDVMKLKGALPNTAAEVAVILVVFALGVLVGSSVQPTSSDMFSFAGGLIGAGITVAGSVYVLNTERRREHKQRKALLLELLNDVDHACEYFQLANESALKKRYRKSTMEVTDELISALARVRRFADKLEPASALMMKVADEIALLEPDPDLEDFAIACSRYPDSADFGGLNAIGHELTGKTYQIRSLLARA